MPIQNFKVLTTFQFEAGAAITEASKLEKAVGGVSAAADSAIGSFKNLGFLLAADLGIAGAGLLGTLGSIIKQFNTIEQQNIKLGGILFANKGFLSGVNSANDALAMSDQLLRKVSNDASKFGLDEKALAQFASITTGITAKEGIDPSRNITFGRNILKAAPQLGINPFEAQGQINRSLLGGASMGDPAFRAIASETTVFKDFAKKVGGITKVSKEFNKLPLVERFNMLNSAFGQFTQSATLLEKQANTIPSLILSIRQSLLGFNGALRPIGEIISGPVKEALQLFLKFIKDRLPSLVQNFSGVLRQLVPNLEQGTVALMQFSRAAGDMSKALTGSLLIGFVQLAFHFGLLARAFKFLGGGALIGKLGATISAAGGLAGIFAKIGPVLGFAARAALAFLGPLTLLFGFFQLLSRARGFAAIEDAKRIPGILDGFFDSLSRMTAAFQIFFAPLLSIFDSIAKFISPLFQVSFLLGKAVDAFKFMEMIFVSAIATIIGALNAVSSVLISIKSGNFANLLDGGFLKEAFNDGVQGFLTDVFTRAGDIPGSNQQLNAPNQTTNIGKVEIRNDFKEKFEPDRIAFALTDQLLKAAQNPTGARNRPFAVGGVSN